MWSGVDLGESELKKEKKKRLLEKLAAFNAQRPDASDAMETTLADCPDLAATQAIRTPIEPLLHM